MAFFNFFGLSAALAERFQASKRATRQAALWDEEIETNINGLMLILQPLRTVSRGFPLPAVGCPSSPSTRFQLWCHSGGRACVAILRFSGRG